VAARGGKFCVMSLLPVLGHLPTCADLLKTRGKLNQNIMNI